MLYYVIVYYLYLNGVNKKHCFLFIKLLIIWNVDHKLKCIYIRIIYLMIHSSFLTMKLL